MKSSPESLAGFRSRVVRYMLFKQPQNPPVSQNVCYGAPVALHHALLALIA